MSEKRLETERDYLESPIGLGIETDGNDLKYDACGSGWEWLKTGKNTWYGCDPTGVFCMTKTDYEMAQHYTAHVKYQPSIEVVKP
ncbi:hypothetical protein BHG00_09865 [Corynebacterium ulcerans]|uniref:hypothetical protein n=1 Tax=Corynebacterium ulcerans TaxID=65058 RepID=UPI0008FB55A6|nr:hypothetical protein [Corynebacterium ulcerans]MBH5301431.1 hypothetical protein [Corynebacterium ulcerans]OIS05327.1 hypothetical protein BHG00_09865 [Corynebacterium ulcerans]